MHCLLCFEELPSQAVTSVSVTAVGLGQVVAKLECGPSKPTRQRHPPKSRGEIRG
jgi:hypothetical protein